MNSQLWDAAPTGLDRASHSLKTTRTWRTGFLSYTAVLCAGLLAASAQAAFQAVDTFDNLNLGTINGQSGWSVSGTSGEVVLDPAGGSNQALEVSTESGTLEKAMTIARNTTRMLFLRLRFEEHGRYSFGASFASNPEEFVDFSAELGMAAATTDDPANDFRVANGLSNEIYDVLTTLVPGTWYNVWVLINNTTDSYEVWLNSVPGGDAQTGDQQDNGDGATSFGFRTAAGTDLQSFFIKTGGGSSPPDGRFYLDDIYLEDTGEANLSNPTDPDNLPGGNDDVIVDFGDVIGLWSWMNDVSWLKLHNGSPDEVAAGDMDGNGADDVIGVFTTGLFVKYNLGGWTQLHNAVPELIAVGDLDNSGQDDAVVDFGGIGLWAYMNNASWLKLNNGSPDQLVTGDMDGNGADDVIGVFGTGIFVKYNLGGWVQLHNLVPEMMTVGDLDNSGQDDLVVDFGGIALWARMNDSAWLKLHNSSPELIATGDVDGNGADDVLATFSGLGLWQKLNLGGWSQLSNSLADDVVTADVTASGKDDIVADFGSTLGGIFVKRDQGAWVKLHNSSPDSMATGNLDGM